MTFAVVLFFSNHVFFWGGDLKLTSAQSGILGGEFGGGTTSAASWTCLVLGVETCGFEMWASDIFKIEILDEI